MARASFLPDQTFAPAPAGTRVRIITAIVAFVFVALVGIQAVALPRHPGGDYWLGVFAPLVAAPIVAAVARFSHIQGYRIDGDELVVVRPAFSVRFGLAGLVTIERDRDPMAGARKRRGNDGLGSVSGRFRSRKFGDFRAYLTDREHGVVLRAAAGTLVVSPAQPEIFIDAVRRRVGRI